MSGNALPLPARGGPPFRQRRGAESSATVEMSFHEPLVAGRPPEELPEGAGCSPELVRRFLDHAAQKK